MDFKIGYNVKPKEINSSSVVIFERWVQPESGEGYYEDVMPTKEECKAYNFNWNNEFIENGEFANCYAVPNLAFKANNLVNNSGRSNSIGYEVQNTIIAGVYNNLEYGCINNVVAGMSNTVGTLVNNTLSIGTLAKATANNSINLGGNATEDILGKRQMIKLIYGGITNDNEPINLFLNNTIDSYFIPELNTLSFFKADILAVSDRGDYKSWQAAGVIKYIIDGEDIITDINYTINDIVSSGETQRWTITPDFSTIGFTIMATGARGATIEWIANLEFSQIKLN